MRARTASLVAALALVAAGCGAEDPVPTGDGGSTLTATWTDPSGAGVLARGPGEPLLDRTELDAGARTGSPEGTELARVGLLTDAHVRDEESPARASFLDRLGGQFSSTFRPQEALSPQVLAGAVRALRGQHPRQVIEAGDLIDNAQSDELDQALAVLRGGRVDPDSGGPGYRGVQDPENPDPFYYRPDVDPPVHRGLLDAAQRPFTSPGLGVPLLPVLGNHDWLVAGVTPPTARLQALATGDRAVTEVDTEAALRELGTDTPDAAAIDRVLTEGLPGRQVAIPADPSRRMVSKQEVVDRLRRAARLTGSGPDLDYVSDLGPEVRLVTLDTETAVAQRLGGPGGSAEPLDEGESDSARASLTDAQAAWLRGQLAAAGDRWVLVVSHRPLDDAALAEIGGFPRVVAVLNGHTHTSSIRPYRVAGGPGFWRIGTASLADWPQQARMLSLRAGADGGVVLSTWMVDPQGSSLVGTARELAYLDAQGGRPGRDAGTRRDRNVRLYRGPA